MHLKKLEIQGFKSFADKTEIEFKNGITGIVGPNGSGKSNISDAIRWVLGEQSIKTLRGNKMEDVIFSGTDKRRPLGFSEVTIIFDNKDEIIPIDYSEVSVTRRMFRSGESEYYINKNSCRLKDIKELFMDTGVGKDGYSIIGQGRVDEILSTKSEDRRNIFEEAAGIVKYKAKKEEGEKKLEKTEENLLRINDILFELEGQIDPLREQSNIAKEYLKKANQLKILEVNLFINEIDRLKQELINIEKQKKDLNQQVNAYTEEKEKIENRYFSIKSQIDDMDKSIDEFQNKKYSIQSNIDKKEHQLILYDENEKFYKKEKERLKKGKTENLKLREELLKEKRNLIDEIETKKRELSLLNNRFLEESEILKKLISQIETKEKDIDKEKDNIVEAYNSLSDKKNKANSLEIFKESIRKRIDELDREINALSKEKDEMESIANKLNIEKEKKEEELKVILNDKKKYQEKEEYLKEEYEVLFKKINEDKSLLQGKISNHNLLKNMEEDYEGYYKSVRSLLLSTKKEPRLENGIVGVIGELLKVDEEYEKAIEVALGSSLQNIVTNTEGDAKFAIEYLRKNNLGRVTFLPLSAVKGKRLNINMEEVKQQGGIGIGSDLIKYDEKYSGIFDYLLGRTLVVKDIDCGIKLSKKHGYSFRIVTLDGDVLNPGGSITGGSMSKNSTNILNRKNRMTSLSEEIQTIRSELNFNEGKADKMKTELYNISNFIKGKDEKIQSMNIEIIQLENNRDQILSDMKKNEYRIEKCLVEIQNLNKEIGDINSQVSSLEDDIVQLEKGRDLVKDSIKEMVENFERQKNLRQEKTDKITELKIQINSIDNTVASSKERLLYIDRECSDILNTLNEIDMEYDENCVKIQEVNKFRQEICEDIDANRKLLEECILNLNKLKENKKVFMENFTDEQEKLKRMDEKINLLEKNINNLDVKYAKYSVQIENYNSRLEEEYELNYEEALGLKIEIKNFKEVEGEVRTLKNDIKNLGTVNLGSIEEYKKVKERFEFINTQKDDLLSAKKSLKEVIKDMESKMEKQFLENFSLIRENFQLVFKELFGGGKADVYLVDEENVLESGIEIIAQPPGKKLQSLSLLSGGEKSLTAVALLFAILKTKPTPFCILDEIDAALDEANITRYTLYLKSFSENTQFIMITHRKGTMEIADTLYGVTMEEEGISRLVSVKLSDKMKEKAS